MKKGSGDDPFADIEDEDEDQTDAEAASAPGEPQGSDAEDTTAPDREGSSTGDPSSSTKERYTDTSRGTADEGSSESPEPGPGTVAAGSVGDSSGTATGQTKAEADGIPWVLRRSRVKEDRENVHQFFLREEYSAREDEIIEAVADELDLRQKDIQKLDVREAMVAAADPEEVAAVLREWGYEYL
jgi:hypothetical protein